MLSHSFKIIKKVETLCTARLLNLGNSIELMNAEKPLSVVMQNALFQDCQEFQLNQNQTNDVMSIITLLNAIDNPHHIAQLFGTFRHWGYPILDYLDGIKNVKAIAQQVKTYHEEDLAIVTRDFKYNLCLNHHVRTGAYPNLNLTKLSSLSYLVRCLEKHSFIDTFHKVYRHADWDMVSGLKTFAVKVGLDWPAILADKAHVPNKNVLLKYVKQGSIGPIDTRRVLLSYLKENYDDISTFLQDINDNGFTPDECIIGVRPKERELKVEGRLFAMLTMKARLYFTSTEVLLSESIIPLFPQTIMGDGALTLSKRIYNSSRKQNSMSKLYTFVINIDFEKWNSNMRHQLTNGPFTFIDELFGYQS